MSKQIITGVIILIVILVALLTRAGAVIVPLKDFDSDEAVVGLMAREILAGEAWPVFYAGQSYLGALEPWSVAAAFALLGESASSLRLVPLLYSLAFLVAAYFLLRRFFLPAQTGLILLWAALGTPFFNLWTVKARGGFAEVLLLGTLFLLVFDSSWRLRQPGTARLLVLGAAAGAGLFVNPLVGTMMAVPLLALAARALAECRPRFAAAGWTMEDVLMFRPLEGRPRVVFLVLSSVGLLALSLAGPLLLVGDEALEGWVGGSLAEGTDLVLYTLVYFAVLYLAELAVLSSSRRGGCRQFLRQLWEGSAGLQMLIAIAAGHLAFSVAATSALSLLGGGGYGQPFRLAPLVSWPGRALLLFGEIVPAATWRLAGLAGPLMAALCVWVGVVLVRRRRELRFEDDGSLPPISALTLFGGTTVATMLLILTSGYAQDASAARYLLPLLVGLPATLYLSVEAAVSSLRGGQVVRNSLLAALTVGLAAGTLWAPASILSPHSSESPYPGLIEEIESRGGETFIADYWTAYPLAFLAGGRIRVAPADGADRFPAVSAEIRSADPDAYVFAGGSAALESFRASLQAADRREEVVRPTAGAPRYHLFYLDR